MLFWTTLKIAIDSLLSNKFRTFLAMLGIIIGVGAVIAMLAIGSGAQKKILASMDSFGGASVLFVSPQYSEENGAVTEDVVPTLTVEDAMSIVENVPDVHSVTPISRSWGLIKCGNKNVGGQVYGVSSAFFLTLNPELNAGRFFTTQESEKEHSVAVIGPGIAETLFGPDEDPIDSVIKINERNFYVIGVIKRVGSDSGRDDRVIYVPYKVAMKKVNGTESLDEIAVKVNDVKDMDRATAQMIVLLRRRHHLRPTQSNDFHIRSQEAMLEMVMDASATFRILIASIAGISLLVGGIGIMNIMLVTVRERTKEIGIRKAVGARNWDIMRQFLLESVLMCSIGGILGVGAGWGASYCIRTFSTQFQTSIEIYSLLLSLGVASGVGIFFGWFPARRAAKLDTIDALRYE